jgi:hypothetical protein
MIHRVTYVLCDGCSANDSADMADEGATATEQRKELKEMGWNHSVQGDLCPECWHAYIVERVSWTRREQGLPV